MKTYRYRTQRRRVALATIMSASLLLTSCGINTASSPNNNAANTQQTTFDEAMKRFTNASWANDPRDTTGLSTAASIGDVTPIADEVNPQLPVSLTDSDGHDVTVNDVSRILPLDLYGTTSRTVAGLGLRDNIIGRTVSSEEPSLADLPVVTQGGHNLNVEAILNLKPSLVIVDHSIGPATAIDQIRDSGVTVVVIEPKHTMDSIGEDIQTIANVVGLEEEGKQLAERSVKEKDEAIKAARERAPEAPLRMSFVYARGTGGIFFILGSDRGTRDLFEAIGGEDLAGGAGIKDMTPANAESLAKLDPEVMVMMSKGLASTGGEEGMKAKPGVSQTVAGKKGRIVAIPDSQALSFGPQTGEAILAFAEAVYGAK